MKRWEEQQRKKLYNNRISQAKPTLVTQPKRLRQSTASLQSQQTQRIGSAGGLGFLTGEEVYQDYQSPSQVYQQYGQFQTPAAGFNMSGGGSGMTQASEQSVASIKRQDQPIFHLLKAFKLQQYASKLSEIGYGQDIYKLALLNDSLRYELIDQLKVLPGHKAKLISLFDVIDELYPRKVVAEQLKQFTPGSNVYGSAKNMKQSKRVQSAAQNFRVKGGITGYGNYRVGTAGMNQRSLIHQYDALDPQTKQAFNNTFLINLESVKYSIPHLFQQHFQPEDRKNAINYIFPPSNYYSQATDAVQGYDPEEVQQLVTKYVGRAATLGDGVSHQRQGSSSQGRNESDQHLKLEMAHTMKVIEKINKEFENMTRASQHEYDIIKSLNQKSQKQARNEGTQKSIVSNSSSSYIKQKSTVSTSNKTQITLSAVSSKPQSVSSSKRSSNHNTTVSIIRQPANKVQAPLPVPHTVQNPSAYELGRLQSNRALARAKQMLPRVITEHEIASEMTTPHSKNPRDRSLSTERVINKQLFEDKQSTIIVVENESDKLTEREQRMEVDDDDEMPEEYQEEEVQQDTEQQSDEEGGNIGSPCKGKQLKNEESFHIKIEQVPDKPKRKLSPLLEREERELLWNNALGHSFDSKQVASALGYLDLKQICLCLAHALNRHIQFSQGFYFLDDLQEQVKALQLEDQIKLDFSYGIDPKLKIGLDPHSQRVRNEEQVEVNRREFEELKHKLKDDKKTKVFDYTATKDESPIDEEQFDRGSDDIEYGVEGEDEEQYIKDYYGNNSGGVVTLEDEQKKLLLVQQALKDLMDDQTPKEDDDEPLDLDYSFSHLEDFLRSHRGTGSNMHPPNIASSSGVPKSGKNTATTQQLMNTFLTSYNKNKAGGVSARAGTQEPIKEAEHKADESGSNDSLPRKPQFTDKKLVATSDSLKIDVRTKEGFKDLIRFQMRIFDYNYDFENDMVVEGAITDEFPSIEELYYYCKYVIISGRMEKEIPILCLVYIERFLTKTGILLNHLNWRRLTLISLCLASKIWDDDSLENVHFPKVMPDVSLKEISSLEKIFLQFLDFDLIMRGAEYAKYYFIMKTFSADPNMNSCLPPVGPLTSAKMSELQNNTAKVESELRDKYEIRVSLQKTM